MFVMDARKCEGKAELPIALPAFVRHRSIIGDYISSRETNYERSN